MSLINLFSLVYFPPTLSCCVWMLCHLWCQWKIHILYTDQRNRQTDRQRNRETDRERNRQTDRETDKETDRETYHKVREDNEYATSDDLSIDARTFSGESYSGCLAAAAVRNTTINIHIRVTIHLACYTGDWSSYLVITSVTARLRNMFRWKSTILIWFDI